MLRRVASRLASVAGAQQGLLQPVYAASTSCGRTAEGWVANQTLLFSLRSAAPASNLLAPGSSSSRPTIPLWRSAATTYVAAGQVDGGISSSSGIAVAPHQLLQQQLSAWRAGAVQQSSRAAVVTSVQQQQLVACWPPAPQHSLADPPQAGAGTELWADSVRRKRQRKMNKHKHRYVFSG